MFTDGVLYNQFLSQADYETVRNYADELGYNATRAVNNISQYSERTPIRQEPSPC